MTPNLEYVFLLQFDPFPPHSKVAWQVRASVFIVREKATDGGSYERGAGEKVRWEKMRRAFHCDRAISCPLSCSWLVGGSPDHISRIWSSCSFAFTPNVDQEKEEHLVINHHSLASTITHPSPWPSPNSLNIVCTTCLLPNCISRKIPVITGSQPRMHTRHNDAGAGSGEILGNCVVVMIGN